MINGIPAIKEAVIEAINAHLAPLVSHRTTQKPTRITTTESIIPQLNLPFRRSITDIEDEPTAYIKGTEKFALCRIRLRTAIHASIAHRAKVVKESPWPIPTTV
jgi:hypothetical protein